MSTNGSYFQGQQPAPQVAFNNNPFSSNNPFRNRATSPASVDAAFTKSPTSPFDDPAPPPRPLSRNPFLDQPPAPIKPADIVSARSTSYSLTAEDIFGSLTLDDNSVTVNRASDPPLPSQQPTSDRPLAPRREVENQPPARPANSRHRPTHSQEEALRARKPQPANVQPGSSTDSPQRKPQRRPRRNSDSSLMDFDAKPLTEEEKKATEAKRRERERRREGKERSKPGRPSRKMDIIDQLDATSIYGTGLFHHDGPFDALNPHRNRQNSRRLAPMQAFPKDSLNNTLGGSGPLNSQADHSTFMGHGTDEAFRDFASSGKNKNGYDHPSGSRGEPAIFDSSSRGTAVHGDESHGLGTSTFLEGTPAARSAILRRQAEQAQEIAEGGLQRKKSLAQRIRHINKGPRGDFSSSSRMSNVESRTSPDQGRYGSSAGSESNPYFAEFGKDEEAISVKPRNGKLSPPPMPRRSSGSALERRATTDATSALTDEPPSKSSGLLGRMKSLKGGRRPSRTADTGMAV